MIVDLVFETCVPFGISSSLTFKNYGSTVREYYSGPDEEHARLAERNLTIVGANQFRSLRPLYWRAVEAFFGMASGAFAVGVPQGWTQGIRPASSSAMILSVISS